MKKIILFLIVGLSLSLGSIYLLYLFLLSLEGSASFLLLGGSLLMLSIGVFLLMKASKPESQSVVDSEITTDGGKAGFEGVLQKNNEIANEWNKTIKQRDQLKMLEISENAKVASE